jgi:hypothetical protein
VTEKPLAKKLASLAALRLRGRHDRDGERRATTQVDITANADEARFSSVALATARPLYWKPSAIDARVHADNVGKLLEWCLELPRVSVGLDPSSVGLIVRSIYAQRNRNPSPLVNGWLDRVGASRADEASLWPTDVEHFGGRLCRLLRYLRSAKKHSDRIWLQPNEARWWIRETAACLREYGGTLSSTDAETHIRLRTLCNRHVCTLFAPFDGTAFLQRLEDLLDEEDLDALIDYRNVAQEILEYRDTVYWSWRLMDFRCSNDNLIAIPLLTLWSNRPASAYWAPQPPQTQQVPTYLSSKQTTSMLADLMWERLESLFSIALHAHGLSEASVNFAGYSGNAPVFYYADLVDAPARPEDYATRQKPSIKPLVNIALSSEDPTSEEVAWGVLEAHLAVLRRETTYNDSYRPWYLVLPLKPEATPPPNLGENVEEEFWHIVNRLTYLEFTFGDEARDIHGKMESIAARHPLWTYILDEVRSVTTGFTDLLTISRSGHGAAVYEELEKLHVLQMSLQAKLEEEKRDAEQEQGRFEGYAAGTESFLKQHMRVSLLAHDGVRGLRGSLLEPFPYKELADVLRSAHEQMNFLQNSIDRIKTLSETVNVVLQNADQRARESLQSRTSVLSILIGFLALIGLAEFIPAARLDANNYPSFLPFSLTTLANAARGVIVAVGLAAVVIAILYGLVWMRDHPPRIWIRDGLPRRRKLFGIRVQGLWALTTRARGYSVYANLHKALQTQDLGKIERLLKSYRDTAEIFARQPELLEYTAEEAWKKTEEWDTEATQSLEDLWEMMDRAYSGHKNPLSRRLQLLKTFKAKRAESWLERARYARYRISLLILYPEVIPLPRTLCVMWCKSRDFFGQSTLSDQTFNESLEMAGFKHAEVNLLKEWLSLPDNQEHIRRMNVRKLAAELANRGVTSDPSKRTPNRWKGSLVPRSS